ncbi:MAG TPA: molybdopterin-guanine dinucleotide biosynthesis protein B [Calditrichaeota bacterium]|nr:molybdopterin-guanine dinucleotide biosynthesis protein B [Calditrichota bacterium]
MKTLHIIGPKKSGKTKLINFLIQQLTERGYRIGAYKHSAHLHPLDKPGSDSDSFCQSGAAPVIFESRKGVAAFFPALNEQKKRGLLEFIYKDCQIVLIESFSSAGGAKIIIQNKEDKFKDTSGIIAVVNEDGHHPRYPAFRPQSHQLVEFIIKQYLTEAK